MALLLLAASATAQLPLARLHTVFPPGTTAGATRDVSVTGAELDEPSGLLFSDPRLRATPKAGSPAFSVTVPNDVPAGSYDVRFVGRFGVSNPRSFTVGELPELVLDAVSTTPSKPTELPLDTTANGRVTANQAHWFGFPAKAGQRLVVRIDSREIDSRLLPDVTVVDPKGAEIPILRRTAVSDFVPTTDGPHLLKLHDLTYRGGEEFFFRLTVGTRPHVDFAIPNVLRRGETRPVTLFGRNLPGGQPSALTGADGRPLDQVVVKIAPETVADPATAVLRKPAAAAFASDCAAWSWKSAAGKANPIVFAWSTNAVLATALPPSPLVTTAQIPCEVTGLFPRRGEPSGASFAARKGDVLWVEVFADRLGPNADPALLIQRVTKDDKGQETYADVADFGDTDFTAGGREFEASHRDPAGRFQAPEDGTYRVLVRDLFRSSPTAPRLPYRLSIRRETPDFALAAFPQPPPRRDDNDRQIHLWTTALRRHETLPVRVVAFRKDGFNGDIDLEVRGLPVGMTGAPVRIPAGQQAATLLLTASSNAPAGSGLALVTGRSSIAGTSLVRTATVATVRWLVPNWDQERGDSRLASELPVAVIEAEPAPIDVRLGTSNAVIQVAAGGKVSIPLAVARRFDYPAAFNLKPTGHGELDKAKEIAIPEKATQVAWELNLAEVKLPEGDHVVSLQGFITGKYRNNPQAAEAADRASQAAAKTAADAAEELKKATTRLAELDKEVPSLEAKLKEARGRTATGTDPKIQEAIAAAEAAFNKGRESRDAVGNEKKALEPKAAAAEKAKTDAAAAAKAANERAAPRDVPVRVYSAPFTLRVTPAAK